MISGHSFLPNDRDFGHVELSKEKSNIFVPKHWEEVVKQAGRKNRFHVSRMNREEFFSLKPLKQEIINRKVNRNGAKVQWLKMHWIFVSKDSPFQFKYRYSNNTLEAWKTVDLKRKTRSSPGYIWVASHCLHSTTDKDLLIKRRWLTS